MKTQVSSLVAAIVISVCSLGSLGARPASGEREMAEFWENPSNISQRNLRWGPGGTALAPDPQGTYALLKVDDKGFSPGYDVRDARGRLWNVKLGPEAQTEVVVSRLLWAIGYHQPAVYYLPRWTLSEKGASKTSQPEARFRLEPSTDKDVGDWSWRDNPFIGTRPFEGLFVFMVLVNNWDLKTTNNSIYQVESDRGPRSMYVVKDLGGSLGKATWPLPGTRNDLEGFERERFIDRIAGNRVTFHYQGGWREPHLVASATPADVRWMCDLLARLSPQQWNDAFRAAGFTETEASRYIRRLRQKIAEGQNIG